MVLEDGGSLPPPPELTHLVDADYHVYERDLGNTDGAMSGGVQPANARDALPPSPSGPPN